LLKTEQSDGRKPDPNTLRAAQDVLGTRPNPYHYRRLKNWRKRQIAFFYGQKLVYQFIWVLQVDDQIERQVFSMSKTKI